MGELITYYVNMRVLAVVALVVTVINLYLQDWAAARNAGAFLVAFEGIHRIDLTRSTMWEVFFSRLAHEEEAFFNDASQRDGNLSE